MEKRPAPGQHATQQRVLVIAPLQHRVEQQGQQSEAEHKRREGLLAVTKVVLEMVALGLAHVGVFVGDLPPPTPRWRNVHNVVNRQAMMGDRAMVLPLFTRFGMDDRAVAPMDRPGIGTTAQEHVVDVPPQRHCRAAPMPAASCTRGHPVGGLPKRQALIERGMGVGLTRQDEGKTVVSPQRTQGLVAGEIIAQSGDAMGRDLLGMFGQPAFAGRSFAVLVGMPVLRHDVCRGQGDALRLSGADDHRGNGRMRREGWAIAALPRETVVAMHDLGRKGVGAIQGHQQVVAKRPKRRQHAVLFKALKDLNKHRIECVRGDGIEQRSDLIITGNLLDTQQGMRIIVASVLLQGALVV